MDNEDGRGENTPAEPNVDEDQATETALVEVAPGTALVFGKTPEGVDLVPFRLVSPDDRASIEAAVARSSSVLNVGAQLATGLAQTEGLVRLAPQTLAALRAGATPVQSGAYNIGVLAGQNGKFVAQVRWLPASGVQTASVVASLGPALTMLAIQAQLNEVTGLVRENLALTETVLKTVRHEQWAELSGLEQAVTKTINEAISVGAVTPLLWDNVAGYEAAIQKQRDLFRRNVEAHLRDLSERRGPQERRQFVEQNGEAVMLDLHSLMLAHKAWFEYQALRAGRARLDADDNPHDAKLLETIVEGMQEEHQGVVDQMTALVDATHREFALLAELPGKRTIPFTSARRSSDDLKRMAQELVRAVERLSSSVHPPRGDLEPPATLYLDKPERLDGDLRILRWLLEPGEGLEALATARELGVGGALSAVPGARSIGSNGVLIALTDQRVLVADISEFRNQGLLGRSLPNDEIRYVRFRSDAGGGQAELDLIAKDVSVSWRFADGSASEPSVRAISALLGDRMHIPQTERDDLVSALPAGMATPAITSASTTSG